MLQNMGTIFSLQFYSFGTSARPHDLGYKSISPGPGNYSIPCSFGQLPAHEKKGIASDMFKFI
jgi:hypothetical protein